MRREGRARQPRANQDCTVQSQSREVPVRLHEPVVGLLGADQPLGGDAVGGSRAMASVVRVRGVQRGANSEAALSPTFSATPF